MSNNPGRSGAIFDASLPYSPLSVPAAQTALLIMDFQSMIVGMFGTAAGPAALETAAKIRDWARIQGMPIFHCLVDTRSGTKPRPHMKTASHWHRYEEALSAKPEPGDEPAAIACALDSWDEKLVTRMPGHVSVLLSPGLTEALQTRGVKSLILAGLSTSGCVMSTVRSATDAGFQVTVVKDACADPVVELHDLLMQHALASTAHIATAEEIQEAWKVQAK